MWNRFCPDRDVLGVARLELPKLLDEPLLPDVEAMPPRMPVYHIKHVLTWESSLGLRYRDEQDDPDPFEPHYRRLFSWASLGAALNLQMLPSAEDVTFAF